MRTYIDIDTFSEWTSEEQYQFALAVTKGLIMDMVRKANSGHSGGPMSSADFTEVLFTKLDSSNFLGSTITDSRFVNILNSSEHRTS